MVPNKMEENSELYYCHIFIYVEVEERATVPSFKLIELDIKKKIKKKLIELTVN